MAHEAVERREPADAEHDDVAFFARADAKLRQRAGASALGVERGPLELKRLECFSPVGVYESGHVDLLPNSGDAAVSAASRIF
jgi:hypothetical protein